MMDYEKEIQRALIALQINKAYEIPTEHEILDARLVSRGPRTTVINERKNNAPGGYENDPAEAALDEEVENLEEANSGSESVHDYFSYSTAYPTDKFMNIQTLPLTVDDAQNATRLDRCSSNDSGLGTSSSHSPSQKTSPTSQLINETVVPAVLEKTVAEDTCQHTPAQFALRKRFPKLGVSSLAGQVHVSQVLKLDEKKFVSSSDAVGNADNSSMGSTSYSQASSSDESEKEEKLRTSTPQQSPVKVGSLSAKQLLGDWPVGTPMPTVEDLLYPGYKNHPSTPSKFTKNSKKILSGFKLRTSTGLLKLKSTVADMMKSERDELLLQQQVYDKILRTARDEDDFSIHMIEEASLQRLAALTTSASAADVIVKKPAFPPSGGLQPICNQRNASQPMKARMSKRQNSATRVARLKKRMDGKTLEDQKRHKRNRRMISEVRKRVQEAHQRKVVNEDQLRNLTANQNVPLAYKGRKLVYTRGGQVPQYRNGDLDWNYLWFFSDSSSATTNSTNSSSLAQPIDPSNLNQTATSGEFNTSDSASTSSSDNTPPPPPTQLPKTSRSISVMRQATKKRIRRLAAHPPTEENLTLLGMV